IRLYCGGNGPLSLKVGGEHMDGLIFGGTFQAVGLTGKLPSLVQVFDDAAKAAGKPDLPKVAEIKLSISQDARAARQFIAHSAGSRSLSMRHRGYPDEVLASVGVTSGEMDRFEAALTRGPSREEADGLVTDSMIDAIFVAGDPAFCRDRMKQVCELARATGWQQLMCSELGPDPGDGMRMLCDEIIPSL